MLDMLEVGVITAPHGLKGEVKIFVTSDDPYRFDDLEEVILMKKGVPERLVIENVKYVKGRPVVKFKGFDRIEDVEGLRRQSLYVTRDMALPLGEGEFFIGDVLGSRVLLEDGSEYGTLKDVMATGANDVFVIERPGGEEVLLPAIRDCVLKVDPEQKEVLVRPMREI